jgi:putative transposase
METTLDNVRLLRQGQILKEWWSEVKENFWDTNARLKVKELLKTLMEQTLIEDLQVQRQKMSEPDYRNGYYSRTLVTQFGLIEDLQVPRLREESFPTRVFERYQRHQHHVDDLLQNVFLGGVSTRRVGEVLNQLLETKISATKVSRICQRLDTKVHAHHRRPLVDEYQYLILDAITLKIRYAGHYHNRKVLAAYGMTVFGKREMIDFKQARGESKDAWESFLQNLYHRGFEGKHLKLIVMDGSPGLKAACELVFPQARIQRCWFHKLQNVSNYCKKKYQEPCIQQARKIYQSKDSTHALKEFKLWKKSWQILCPEAVHCLEKDLEQMLPFLDCPKSHPIRIRTTNVIERTFREARRRIRVFSCFTNIKSSERILFAIFDYLNHRWIEKPLKQFTQFN